ncbi:phage tail protein [Corallococcus interemptor]|uniref:phage tail protein n=1 Tax=Corallococcus interemptor TaxID=2316720 RepID=UPI0035D52A4E
MSRPSQRLNLLLPGLYLARDSTLADQPLLKLLAVLGMELDAFARAVDQLWDDHFVERAGPQALPLLAELMGARLLTDDPRVQRGVVARAVAWRRRKGTLASLEEVLSVTSLWDAEVDEAFRSLLETQDLNDLLPWRGRSAVLWDPIGLADPLTRRSPGIERPRDGAPERGPFVGVAPGETLDQALRRLGSADAGRVAATPRTLDLLGWARPDVALIRTARLTPVELEEVTPATVLTLPNGYQGFRVDPLDRDGPLVWLKPLERADLTGGLTARHEPAPPSLVTGRTAAMLLTPTALAEDADAAERAGALTVSVDGIPLVGPEALPLLRGPLPTAPVGPAPTLRFADRGRPSPGDTWRLTLLAARENSDTVLLSTELVPDSLNTVTVTPEANQLLDGTTAALLVERVSGEPRLRDVDGTWRTLAAGLRQGPPRSNAVRVDLGGAPWVVRIEQHLADGSLRLARFDASADGAPWQVAEPGGALPPDGPGMSLAAAGDSLLLVAPDGAGKLGVWSVTGLDTATPAGTRLDAASPRQPSARLAPSLCVRGGRLFVFGGDLGGAPTGDLWSLPVTGGPWRPHAVRNRQERKAATLLSTAQGLMLLGGEAVTGELAVPVLSCDPASASPVWRLQAPLPITASLPGTLVATTSADGVEALVWADTTRPRRMTLKTGEGAWGAGPLEPSGSNPPVPGEALYVDGRVLLVEPAPLPASEVVFSLGGRGYLAFLPELALLPDELLRFNVANDGATFIEPREGQPLPLDSRPGGAYHSRDASVAGGARRYSVPGRLRRHPFQLRQRSLGPWTTLAPSLASGVVAVDPRLGRVVLQDDAPVGRVTVSARVGRGASLGAGLLPPDRRPPAAWAEPDFPFIDPPDRPGDRSGTGLPVTAWISPERAGGVLAAGGQTRPIVGTLAQGVGSGAPPVLGLIGSPRLAPERLSLGLDSGLSLFAADTGAAPCIGADEHGLSLALYPGFGGSAATRVWLAGLWLAGRLELVLAQGQADLRWCNLGTPGQVGLWLPGGGHQDISARRSLPPADVELRLYGCMVGVIELPPWVHLIAAGCTFDAGDRDAVAIRAAGASVRLRHCTVLGATEAGVLEASSCAFAGEVRTDRPDLGWLRYSLHAGGGQPPVSHQSRVHTVSFQSNRQTDPGYLVLGDNNGPEALHASERGGVPGAHDERSDHERELSARADDSMPIGITPFHADRSQDDLIRMSRP